MRRKSGWAQCSIFVFIVVLMFATAMSAFGQNSFAARLPSAVGMTLTLIVLAFSISRWLDPDRAFWTVLILASSAILASLGAWALRFLEPEWANSLIWTPFAPLFVITLLTSAFVVPLGMLLACLWPRALNRMPSLLAFAPIPALAAVLLVASDSALAIGSPFVLSSQIGLAVGSQLAVL